MLGWHCPNMWSPWVLSKPSKNRDFNKRRKGSGMGSRRRAGRKVAGTYTHLIHRSAALSVRITLDSSCIRKCCQHSMVWKAEVMTTHRSNKQQKLNTFKRTIIVNLIEHLSPRHRTKCLHRIFIAHNNPWNSFLLLLIY